MSSAINIDLRIPVILEEWNSFCEKNGIHYSPNTVGRNVYYGGPNRDVEIHFGESNDKEELPILGYKGEDVHPFPTKAQIDALIGGRRESAEEPKIPIYDFSAAKPCDTASEIRLSTFFMGDLTAVSEVLQRVAREFGERFCSLSSDDELAFALQGIREDFPQEELSEPVSMCPYCADEDYPRHLYRILNGPWKVVCRACGLQGKAEYTPEAAVSVWNEKVSLMLENSIDQRG